MRKQPDNQCAFGQIPIEQIWIDLTSRDDIPRVLFGLQNLYMNKHLRSTIVGLLLHHFSQKVDISTGRNGMNVWQIFVLGVLRLSLNIDYDRLCELAGEHRTIREMLGLANFDRTQRFGLTTIKDNLRYFDTDLLAAINEVVVKAGHDLLGVDGTALHCRMDSFVVKTDVHFPTDINLLFDAVRKTIELTAAVCAEAGDTSFRQYARYITTVKTAYRVVQKSKHRKGDQENLLERYQNYLDEAVYYLKRAWTTIDRIEGRDLPLNLRIAEIKRFIDHGIRQIDQIRRRVFENEVIPHDEKVFSLFEPHTEWIVKGKAGVPVELGVRVAIVEDQHRFLLHHRVMVKETDDKVAVKMTHAAKKMFPMLNVMSFDKGFYSKNNNVELPRLLDLAVLPKKGRLNAEEAAIEGSSDFGHFRRKHSAIESAINALDVHGLDRCLDHGLCGFERYVALAILASNIMRLGDIVRKREKKRLVRLAA